MELKGKVILITGASSGIGRELARNLSQRGARLVLLARREAELQKLAGEFSKYAEVLAVTTDVTKPEDAKNAVKRALETFGQVDALINNAGIGYFGPLESIPLEDLEAIMKTNIFGPVNMLQAAVPQLKQSKGMVVNISSSLSKRALPYLSAYAGTKSMVDALSDGMRLELRKYGIHVLNYCPPETDTEFFQNTKRDPSLKVPAEGHRKMHKPEDIAESIVQSMIKEKREVVESSILKVLNFFAPKLLDSVFYKGMVLKLSNDK